MSINYFLISCIQFAETDIFTNCAGEQVRILKNDSERTAKIIFSDIFYVYSVINDFSALDIIKTVYKVGDGGFTRTG